MHQSEGKGMAGNAQATCQGMVHWWIEDDDWGQQTLKIRGVTTLRQFQQESCLPNTLPSHPMIMLLSLKESEQ